MRALHIVVDSHFAALIGDTNSEAVDLFIDSTNTRHAALVLNTTAVLLLHIDNFTNKDLVHFVAWLRQLRIVRLFLYPEGYFGWPYTIADDRQLRNKASARTIADILRDCGGFTTP